MVKSGHRSYKNGPSWSTKPATGCGRPLSEDGLAHDVIVGLGVLAVKRKFGEFLRAAEEMVPLLMNA